MPGVQLPQFRKQLDQLLQRFTRPDEFAVSLRNLFERYGDSAYRVGDEVGASIEPAYHLPPLVMHQLEMALAAPARENPGAALRLATRIWRERYYEPKSIGAYLIGLLPIEFSDEVMDWIRSGAKEDEPGFVLHLLFTRAAERLRREQPQPWLDQIERWLRANQSDTAVMGLRALISLAEDPIFINLPVVYRLLTPFIGNGDDVYEPILVQVFAVLVRRSPAETAFFLQQGAVAAEDPLSLRLIRRLIPLFEPAQQEVIRQGLALGRESGDRIR
ncbi:MAG: hypothetical protein JW750_05485 [Anaerolineaceae bacterium]|nr:hypothetical protein [Anaerolineaceae bacterium]